MGRKPKYKTCQCGFIGYGWQEFPQNANGLCTHCWKKNIHAKRHFNCESCGKECRKKDTNGYWSTRFCSDECRKAACKKMVDVPCVICSKVVRRYEGKFKASCCSRACQYKHRTWLSHGGWMRPIKVSIRLNQKRFRKRLNRWINLLKKPSRRWVMRLREAGKYAERRFGQKSWFEKMRTLARCNEHRAESNRDMKPKKLNNQRSWAKTLEQVAKHLSKVETEDQLWKKKLMGKASNHRKRIVRKSLAKLSMQCDSNKEIDATTVDLN